MNFFVYLHRRASNGKVFYVGKGCRYRHKSLWNRSQHWQNIVNKHGYTIEIVQTGMQEWWAFELECELILKYSDHGLCNRTNGGEGASGFTITEETKQKHFEQRWSDKWRNNLSAKAKERFANPEYRQAHLDRQLLVMNRPEVKEKLRVIALKRFSNPEEIEKTRQNTIKYFSNPEARKLASKKALERFNTPDKRAAHVQAKAVMCIETGKVFGTCTLAAEWLRSTLGCGNNSQISKVCRGVMKTAYGYTWRYITPAKESVNSPRVG
jgi:hypothetical protein